MMYLRIYDYILDKTEYYVLDKQEFCRKVAAEKAFNPNNLIYAKTYGTKIKGSII